MSFMANPLFMAHVDTMWTSLVQEFGVTVDYWPAGDLQRAVPVNLIWIEGAEDEEISPGRYSHALVQNASLPAGLPSQTDAIAREDGSVYDVVQVNAYAYGYARVVLQERGAWPR